MMFGFELIGIGELLTGVLIGVVGLVLAVLLYVVLSEAFWRWRDRNERGEEFVRPPITSGVLICDWVDREVLASVARQRKVEPEPVRMERGQSDASGGRVEGGPRLLRAVRSRERKTEQRSFYEFTHDPNAMVAAVLRNLDDDQTLNRDLDVQPYADVLDTRMLEQVFAIAQDQPEAKTAREAIQTLQAKTLANAKLDELRRLGSREPTFVFIENRWRVTDEDGELWLDLATLRPLHQYSSRDEDYRYGRHSSEALVMPPELSLVARLSKEKLTDAGWGPPEARTRGAGGGLRYVGPSGRFSDRGIGTKSPGVSHADRRVRTGRLITSVRRRMLIQPGRCVVLTKRAPGPPSSASPSSTVPDGYWLCYEGHEAGPCRSRCASPQRGNECLRHAKRPVSSV